MLSEHLYPVQGSKTTAPVCCMCRVLRVASVRPATAAVAATNPSSTGRCCTCNLRVIPAVQKIRYNALFTTSVRGLCPGIPSRFLPARADRPGVGVPDALWAVAIGAYGSSPADPQAAQATPHPLQRAQTLYRSHA